MKELRNTVLIIIPVFNDIKDIDLTMQSIFTQDYDKNCIYITAVDFGSSDGSYEKLMEYPAFNFGLYQYKGNFTRGTMPALARQFVIGQDGWQYQLLLMPGDVIYPQYLKRVTDVMSKIRLENPDKRLDLVVNEVDIRHEDGTIEFETPICSNESILYFEKNTCDYLVQGYKNNMMCFGGSILPELHRHSSSKNERSWWSRIMLSQMQGYIIYLPERLACIKERYYEDELRDILLRWEHIILFIRQQENETEAARIIINKNEVEKTLALYALWRSFLLEKKQNKKQAKECLQIASVIFPEIKKMNLYQWIKELIMEGKTKWIKRIEEEFSK